MPCKICGCFSCDPMFHSIEDQERFEKYQDYDSHMLIRILIERDSELEDLKSAIAKLEI